MLIKELINYGAWKALALEMPAWSPAVAPITKEACAGSYGEISADAEADASAVACFYGEIIADAEADASAVAEAEHNAVECRGDQSLGQNLQQAHRHVPLNAR